MGEPDPPAPAFSGSERRFPCAACGATVEFSPGAQALVCPHCGAENHPPDAETRVHEEDFRAALDRLAGADDHEDQLDITCSACGASLHGLGSTTSATCPYCASNIVATAKSRRLIKPRALLPFAVTREKAQAAFDRWIASLWFAPRDLRRAASRQGALRGVYLPAWTFDANTTSRYTGQRGDAYHVTVPRTVMVGGKPQVRMTRERRIRWTPAAGTVRNTFDDVLIQASESIPRRDAEALEPWDLKALVPYDDAYLAGFGAESYRVPLPDAFALAQGRMRPTIEGSVRAAIGGDEQRVHSIDTAYDGVTYKHLLLPLWISAYRFRGRTYRFYVNARTGEVRGERPWSAAKLSFTVILCLAAIAALVLILTRGSG